MGQETFNARELLTSLVLQNILKLAYQGFNDQYGTWNDISEYDYLHNFNRYRDVRIIYIYQTP